MSGKSVIRRRKSLKKGMEKLKELVVSQAGGIELLKKRQVRTGRFHARQSTIAKVKHELFFFLARSDKSYLSMQLRILKRHNDGLREYVGA